MDETTSEDELRWLVDQLQAALASRDVIGQAKGLIMAVDGRTGEAAFDVLRRASQDRNVKLREVARMLVEAHEARVRTSREAATDGDGLGARTSSTSPASTGSGTLTGP